MRSGWKSLRFSTINWPRILVRLTTLLSGLGLFLFSVWPWLPGVSAPSIKTVIVYGFSILEEVMDQGVFPAFERSWKAETGEDVEFITSFAGSGTITNQMILGVPADVGILSLELDGLRLVEAGTLPGPTWQELPDHGILNRTPFIILVRPGNPKGIHDFADLTRPGIGVIHADPLTSGGAQWAILAEYGSAYLQTGDSEQAYEQLLGIWKNVVSQAPSARAARTQFESGFGDALITYEQELLPALKQGTLNGEIIYPASTILSEHIVVVVDKNVDSDERDLVDAFVSSLWEEPSQRIFVEYGFRSTDESLNGLNPLFGEIPKPFTVADLGGWPQAKREIVDEMWRSRVLEALRR
jgi:sulfate/thiosulfate transport system substrate-binding protein